MELTAVLSPQEDLIVNPRVCSTAFFKEIAES